MLKEGDEVQVHFEEGIRNALADVLSASFEDIDFFFIEHSGEESVTLSAETDDTMAIIVCPLYALKGYQYTDEVEKLFDHIINTHIMDRALRERNEELFQAIIEHNSASIEEDGLPPYLEINELIHMDEHPLIDQQYDDSYYGDEV